MTARTYDIYDLSSPFVTPAAPAATQTARPRPYMQRLAESWSFNASVILAVFAGVVYAIGVFLEPFPLGQVTPVRNFGLWLGVIAGALAVAGAMTAVLVATVKLVTA